jgi:hypothetical protein
LLADRGGLSAVKAGGEFTVIDSGPVLATGFTPLDAETMKEETPAMVGMPESTPVVPFSERPAGREPLVTVKVGLGLPLAVKL